MLDRDIVLLAGCPVPSSRELRKCEITKPSPSRGRRGALASHWLANAFPYPLEGEREDRRKFARAGFFAAAILLLLSACATQSPRTALPAISGDPEAHQQQRAAALAAVPGWSLEGRVALSNGREGGSGRIDWRQDGTRYEVELSAPVTRQSWRLAGAPGTTVTLEGLDGGPRQGQDAQALLLEATRWDIPVDALAGWVRGVAADPAHHGAATLAFGADGRLASLEQDGWRIAYADWRPATGIKAELPHRLDATRGRSRVRLVVDAWQ